MTDKSLVNGQLIGDRLCIARMVPVAT